MLNNTVHSDTILNSYIETVSNCIKTIDANDIFKVLDIMQKTYSNAKTIFIFGNGGSAATSSHIAEDFSKGCSIEDKPALRAFSLTDNTPLLTAISNDISYSAIFEKQLQILYTSGDAVFAISASGNSENVIRGVKYAKQHGGKVISLTGFNGGKLREISDANIHIPVDDFGPVEDLHCVVGHILTVYMKSFIENYQVTK